MIDDIIGVIDNSVKDCVSLDNSVYHGRSFVIKSEKNVFPVTFQDRKYKKICLSDLVDFQTYHKIKEVRSNLSEDFTFGSKNAYLHTYSVTMVGILKNVTDIDPSIIEFIPNSFPSFIKNSDYKKIDVIIEGININDQDNIVKNEFGEINYSKHKCRFFVFEINYSIQAVNCNACVNLGVLLLEDGTEFLLEDFDYLRN